jgi:hypothetical protein
MKHEDQVELVGDVSMTAHNRQGGVLDQWDRRNTVLLTGRRVMAKVLANQVGTTFSFYVTRMLWGDGGTLNGVPRYVNFDRSGLFGTTRLAKPVISTLDPNLAMVTLTSVIAFGDIVGVTLNEMALQMSNGDLYSMTTFPDLNKTTAMQITFNWRLSYV